MKNYGYKATFNGNMRSFLFVSEQEDADIKFNEAKNKIRSLASSVESSVEFWPKMLEIFSTSGFRQIQK